MLPTTTNGGQNSGPSAPTGLPMPRLKPAAVWHGGSTGVVKHGTLSAQQWADVSSAARIARATGTQLSVHGVTVCA